MTTLNKWPVLVWIVQESHLWELLARAKLIVVIAPLSPCLGICTVPCTPTSLKLPVNSSGSVHSSFSPGVIAEVYFTWPIFWGCQQDLVWFLICVRIILGYFDLSYFLRSVLWGKLCVQKFFLLCIFIPFRMTLYWQSSIKGPYCYWELDPLIWMKN